MAQDDAAALLVLDVILEDDGSMILVDVTRVDGVELWLHVPNPG